VIKSSTSDKDMLFKGNDGGSEITALTLDMSAAGAATFNDKITAVGTSVFTNLDISGDVDIDGTTNLDVVDIDGAVDMASTLTLAGNADFNGDLDVDGTTNLDVVDIDGAVDMASTLAVTGAITGATAAFTQTNTVNSPVSARYNTSNKKIAFNINNSNGQGFLASNSNSTSGSANQTYDLSNTAAKLDFAAGVTIDTAASGTAGDVISYVNNVDFLPTGNVFNESSADIDFRVESNGNANMLFVDAGNDHVNIGTSSDFGGVLNVNGGAVFDDATTFDPDTLGSGRLALGQIADGGGFAAPGLGFGGTGGNTAAVVGTSGTLFLGVGDSSGANSLTNMIEVSQANVVINQDSLDADFRVESNSNTHMLFVDGSSDRIGMGVCTDPSTFDSRASTLVIQQSGDVGMALVSGDNSDCRIAFTIAADTGLANGAIRYDNNDDTFSVETAGTARFSIDSGGATTITVDDNSDTLTLKSTDGDASAGPILTFNRNSASPNDGDDIGQMKFDGRNSAGQNVTYAKISANIADATDGTEDGGIYYFTMSGGAEIQRMSLVETETVFNEQTRNIDFRVESDSNVDAFVVDAAGEFVSVGQNTYSSPGNGNNGTGWASTTAGRMWASAASDHGFNRTSDGVILSLRSGGTEEGTIAVSGSSVSFNGFVGRHESSGIPTDTPVGTVVSTIDELDVYDSSSLKAGQTRANHAKVEVSDSVGDSCVYGVLAEFTEKGKAAIASVGLGSVRVTGACSKGDLLESNGDGTAKVQSDNIIRSSTVGKVTIGNSDTGVKLVSCVLYCG
jgi:hypothetical protein